ncbi:MAG: helix-turn-helix transcriptional regulator [Cyanobacteria bacterium SIG26]|nr:helix-turn-helix transcriptional regulator [Cyanobacteria bacterium SIG26]
MKKYKIVQNKELTEREYEVLSYVMQGLTNRQIAKELTITYHTVKAHVAAIIRKTGTKNRLDATLKLIANGLINPPQD